MTKRMWFAVLVSIGTVGASLTGCGSPPSAGVSDFGVYTALHLRAIQLDADADADPGAGDRPRLGESTLDMAANLHRYFGLSATEYKKAKLRMDEMLQNIQRSSGYAQAIQTLTEANLTAALKNVTGDGTPPAPEDEAARAEAKAKATAQISAALKALADKQLENAIADSPFDELDRVADFYAAFILKHLRMAGDSRVIDPSTLVRGEDTDEDAAPIVRPSHRILFLYIQAHVNPGSRPNYMTGVRLKIGGEQRDRVNVVRLHPTRNYDIDSVVLAEDFKQSLGLAATLSAPSQAAQIDAALERKASLEAVARRKFLSRVGKTGSIADASTGMFGWNFYPSNLEVVKPNFFEALGGWLFGTPRAVKVRGTLEAGGRDCSAVVIVPWDLTEFTCEASYVFARLSPDGIPGHEYTVSGETFTVELPTATISEVRAVAGSIRDTGAVTFTSEGSLPDRDDQFNNANPASRPRSR